MTFRSHPDRGARKPKQWPYPAEVEAVLACPELPPRWRRLYTLATYLRTRLGEPVERYGTLDAGFRDPSGNGWKMRQARGVEETTAAW